MSLLQIEDNALEVLLDDPDPEEQERLAQLEELFPYFDRELSRVGVNRWIWGEYRQQYAAGFSYSRFCAHFSQWKRSRTATLFFEQIPGDKLFIDFTGKKLSIVDRATGEVTEVEVYVAILGYSQLAYVQAVRS